MCGKGRPHLLLGILFTKARLKPRHLPRKPRSIGRFHDSRDIFVGAWRLFGHIVLPYLAPVLLVCTLFRLIDSIKAFPLIFLLTGGGPGSVTEVTNYYAYLLGFNFGELGYSSAVTVVLLVSTVLISWAAMRASRNAQGLE